MAAQGTRYWAAWHASHRVTARSGDTSGVKQKTKEAMPYINVKITREGVTPRQKREIIAGVTRLMMDILDKDPQHTHVVIDEIDTDNWGVGGEPVTELRRKAAHQ